MAPSLVFDADGRLLAAVGSPGGSRIIGYVAETLVGLIDWKLSMQDAIDLPRVVNRNGATEIEDTENAVALADALGALGHTVEIKPMTSGLHGLVIRDGRITGGADPRREGVVLGN
jgi:gamma-glutamyltranspeptidase/glutathione hydrolase